MFAYPADRYFVGPITPLRNQEKSALPFVRPRLSMRLQAYHELAVVLTNITKQANLLVD